MENLTQQQIDYDIAKNKVDCIKKLYTNLALFLIVLGFFTLKNFYKSGEIFLPFNHSVIFWIWGIFIAFKAVKLFLFSPEWEKNMINKHLNQNKNGNLY